MVYHITSQEYWNKFQNRKSYLSETFEDEGFIHFSSLNQVDGVLDRYYKDQKNLILLTIDETFLGENLIFEPSTNNELFPHLYGSLSLNAIKKIELIK